MKSSLLTLTFLVVFLSFLPNSLLGASEPLYDINGDEVITGTEYYIVSAIRGGGGGGLNLFSGRNERCPMDVFQHRSDLQRGSPMMFFPVNYNGEKGAVVRASTDMNIQFNVQPDACSQHSTVWKVDNYDEKGGAWFITTNGVIGNPGSKTIHNWFKFEKVGTDLNAYKIVHCPSVCDSCVTLCSDVGINYGTQRRLALSSDSQKPFMLMKVSDVQKYMGRFNAVI
uniref:Vegetative storage protein n=1 Tax=Litchi chinensis TaxID=151069 RepID=Q0Z928_LITCN|nr:vegetative storage protein [Litchi chinensis]